MDYLALGSLDAVIRNQSFSRAARELRITQSAVSQRLSHLEAHHGERILVRELPFRATALGERLLSHFRKVVALEQAMQLELESNAKARPTFKVAVNLDSLELWFSQVLQDRSIAGEMNLDIVTDDEKFTLQQLKAGKVDLSVGSVGVPVSNHECIALGSMTYFLVARPDFKAKYFPAGLTHQALSLAPAVIFNEKDDIHYDCLSRAFRYNGDFPRTAVPSVTGFKRAIVSGFGYGMLPWMDIETELKEKRVVRLHREGVVTRKLYLHHWNYQSKTLGRLIAGIQKAATHLR